jgi:hypothetical protein
MSRSLFITYRIVAIGRLLLVILAFVLAKLYADNLPQTGLFANGIHIYF